MRELFVNIKRLFNPLTEDCETFFHIVMDEDIYNQVMKFLTADIIPIENAIGTVVKNGVDISKIKDDPSYIINKVYFSGIGNFSLEKNNKIKGFQVCLNS